MRMPLELEYLCWLSLKSCPPSLMSLKSVLPSRMSLLTKYLNPLSLLSEPRHVLA